jgi:hypothetical protein
LHRVPATADFDQAAQFILQRAREYGLSDVRSEEFSIDGTKTYGLMRSYLSWKVEEGSLWEVRPQHLLIGDWKTNPIHLADYSRSADVETTLIDIGDGASDQDYTGKDVRGKIVLADGVLSRVQQMAIGQHGAVGIVSDMPNQTTAWSGLDPTLIRWGHLDARQPSGFAFMVSRQAAEALRARLASGEPITLNAHVKTEVGPGHWTVVTGTIPGSDPASGEIVYSCHLDHECPGANDNGSGCVTILESARILAHLIKSGTLPQPKRTLRIVWGPEIEGTMAFSHPIRRSKKNSAPTSTWTWSAAIHLRTRRSSTSPALPGLFQVSSPTWAHPSSTPSKLPQAITLPVAAPPTTVSSKLVLARKAHATNSSQTSRPTLKAAIMMTTTLPPSLFLHFISAIGRTFISTPTTTASPRLTQRNYDALPCSAPPRDMSTHQSTASCCHKLCRIWPRRATSV